MNRQGKEKCEYLRNLRIKIAEENGIYYTPAECHHEGDCPGFCPVCDAELEYITNELQKKVDVPKENVALVADLVDEFTIDIKTMNNEVYKEYTGIGNARVIENLKWLIETGHAAKIKVRVPIIPDYTDEASQAESVAALRRLGVQTFECFEYKKYND